MQDHEVKTYSDLLRVINAEPYEPRVEVSGIDIELMGSVTAFDLDPWDRLTVTGFLPVTVNDLPAEWLAPEYVGRIVLAALHTWQVEGEAQCCAQNVIDRIYETTGYRGSLYEWLEEHESIQDVVERVSAEIDRAHDRQAL